MVADANFRFVNKKHKQEMILAPVLNNILQTNQSLHIPIFWCRTEFLAVIYVVLRYGKWSEEDTAVLVPGDIVRIKLGNIIPADAHLLEGDPLKIDQSALTLESLPVAKHPGDGGLLRLNLQARL